MTGSTEAGLIDRLKAISGFLAERFGEELDVAMRQRPDDVRHIEAKIRVLSVWPDPMGQWSPAEADAARAVKLAVYRQLAVPYGDHPDFDTSWLMWRLP